MQSADAKKSRASGKAPTNGEASANAKKQLKAAGLTEKEIKCIMNKVNAMIKKMCPGMTNSTKLRIPGS